MKLTTLILAAAMTATSAQAGDNEIRDWINAPPTTSSARLAGWDWEHLSSAGLSWPDGRQAIITFWRAPGPMDENTDKHLIFRCVDYFNPSFQPTGGSCKSTEFSAD